MARKHSAKWQRPGRERRAARRRELREQFRRFLAKHNVSINGQLVNG